VPRSTRQTLIRFYDALFAAYGPQGWWPARSRTEIVVGAILTQNTNWRNVERAIANLRAARLLTWKALRDAPANKLARLIRPSGYFNIKARRLKCFVNWLWDRHRGNFEDLRRLPLGTLRAELLSVSGIGPETADSIILYALRKPTFVADAYTARLLRRHGLVNGGVRYDELKAVFEDHLPADERLFNQYHALIVAVGKKHCRPRARCDGCPLQRFEHDPRAC